MGIVYARSDTLLATDLDHLFTAETLEHVLGLRPLGRTIYRFRRRGTDGAFMKPHPNSFVMSRGRFLGLYGVDEEFSGAYGCEDGMFWRWQRYNGTRFRYFARRYASRMRDYDRQRSDHSLVRDTRNNQRLKHRKIREWSEWGPIAGHSRRFLEFSWDVIEDRQRRPASWQPGKNRLWKKLWWWRFLFG